MLERARPYLLSLLLPLIVVAAGSLVLEYGFHVTPETKTILRWTEVIALAGIMLDPLLRLALARERVALARFRWFDLSLIAAFGVYLAVTYYVRRANWDVWAMGGVHAAIILGIISRLVELHRYLAALQVKPGVLMLGSFLAVIGIGTGLLLVPAATAPGRPATTFMDAVFTATSAVCVTGLTVVDTGTHWSRFGQYVILGLIQLGGLGLMTYASVFALLLWRGMRVRETLVLREVFTHDLRAEIGRLTVFIILTTLAIEAAGTGLLMGLWDHTAAGDVLTSGERLFYSVFHSVSAFCNAGLCLYSDSLMTYRNTWQANLVFPALIVSGGIGFAVLYNLARIARHRLFGRGRAPLVKRRLTLQAKIVLAATVVLVAAGMGLGFVLETFPGQSSAWYCTAYEPVRGADAAVSPPADPAAPLAESPMGGTWAERACGAWFLSVTARTAGFNTIDVSRLAPPTKFLTSVLMFIGASPGSTGGGIKTVTVAVILCGVWATVRGQADSRVFRRALPRVTVLRALAILAVCVMWVSAAATVVAAWGMRAGVAYSFLDVLFESTSAFATCGLSTGATPLLNTLGRLVIIVTMLAGRIGPLTMFVAMQGHWDRPRYTYATEDVAIS